MRPKPQHAAAHVITRLDATHEISEWHEPHGTLQSVVHVDEAQPGIMYHARLGASGLQLIRGDIVVCLPLEELFALAARVNPAFTAPPNAVLPAADLAKLVAGAPKPEA